MKALASTALLLSTFNVSAASPQCAAAALAQASKLLTFHTAGDDRAEVDSQVKPLPSLANPANKAQKFLVLEVMGHVYKGDYRMRLIYYPLGTDCILMGQEIIELAKL